ncbi:MAG TPA: AI-2E family transporter [Tenericutes bacterium]|nr:AI-2E family transporter [Mycoplasmatota bacterium]
MFLKRNNDNDVDTKKLNELISVGRKILSIAYVLLIILGVYSIIIVLKELNTLPFIFKLLKIASPLFIGIIIAWLFDPLVRFLNKKGLKRSIGAAVTYAVILGALILIISAIIPLISEQLNDFAKTIPSVFDSIESWIDGIFDKFSDVENLDITSTKQEIFTKIENFGVTITEELPDMTFKFVKTFFSGMGTFLVGLIIGFYLLISFDNASDIITFIPNRFQEDTRKLVDEINNTLRKFVQGALFDATLIFILSLIGFSIFGLKAPALFALFCALTNVIPYVGPYIGGVPAVIVAFSQNATTGILILIFIVIVQFLEGNFIQTLIMSKTTKLHPVTIMLGLLIFGYFWGILGMLISTPVIAVLKVIFVFFDEKYNLLNYNN